MRVRVADKFEMGAYEKDAKRVCASYGNEVCAHKSSTEASRSLPLPSQLWFIFERISMRTRISARATESDDTFSLEIIRSHFP